MYSIQEVSQASFTRFQPEQVFIPKNYHYKSTYWYRIKIQSDQVRQKTWILEFYDQTIDHIAIYAPDGRGGFKESRYGQASLLQKDSSIIKILPSPSKRTSAASRCIISRSAPSSPPISWWC